MPAAKDDSNSDARAVDGLDWRAPAEQPVGASAEPLSSQHPDADEHQRSAPGAPKPGLLIAVAAAAAVVGGLVSGVIVSQLGSGRADAPGASPQSAARATLFVEQTSAVADVAARARPGVVRVESSKRAVGGVENDVGSGVVIDLEGHVITNAHVVLNTSSLKVVLSDGTERPAILIGHDFPFTDVAVLQISPGRLTPIEIGDSSALHLGDAVVAIGNPLAEFDGSVNTGVISGKDRKRTFDSVRQDGLLQTDAAVNNGNSGGALLNLKGQFIGMPTAVLRQSRGGQPVEGIAFALPSNRLMPIVNRIIAEGGAYPRPTLELEHLDITDEVLQRAPRLAVTEGALVTAIVPNGAGATSGIQAGDVLTSVGDLPVNRDSPLLNAFMAFEPGQATRVVLNRNGRIIELEVRFARRS